MAREHARLWLDINTDGHFQSLTFDAQAFYTRIVLTDATLNYCGVMDWRPRRLTVRARDLTLGRVMTAAAELERENYLLFDIDTEECLARSFVRRDELIRNPKMAATVIKAYGAVASPVLQAAIVSELRRIKKEHPDYTSWSHKDTAAGLERLLENPALETVGYTNQISVPNPVPITNPDPVPITNPDAVRNSNPDRGQDHQSKSVPIPSTSTLHPSPAPEGGYVSTEGHQADDPDPPTTPPRFCPEHPAGTDRPCLACQAQRKRFERWEAEQREAATEQRRAELAEAAAIQAMEIADCELCDDDGYAGLRVCDHVDRGDTAARGAAAVRAALAKGGDQ